MNSVEFNRQNYTPSKIMCIGRNYVAHAKELGNEVPAEPIIFIKPNSAISDEFPNLDTTPVHYETELCFLIKNNTLAAVGLGLDLTKREIQSRLKEKGLPWERAKSFDASALFTPFVALPQDFQSLHFTLTINDRVAQKGDISLMQFKPERILKECQEFLSFEDGDVLMTGTPEGVGAIQKGNKYTVRLFQYDKVLIEHSWSA
ncbi:MAG: fumarylacetoacetate hydrolase family protein [Agarilytica sp.]